MSNRQVPFPNQHAAQIAWDLRSGSVPSRDDRRGAVLVELERRGVLAPGEHEAIADGRTVWQKISIAVTYSRRAEHVIPVPFQKGAIEPSQVYHAAFVVLLVIESGGRGLNA